VLLSSRKTQTPVASMIVFPQPQGLNLPSKVVGAHLIHALKMISFRPKGGNIGGAAQGDQTKFIENAT